MIQNDLKSFQNPKIVPKLSICFVKHFFYFIYLLIYLWSALNCVEDIVLLCDQFSYFWCQPYFGCLLLLGNSLPLPPYPCVTPQPLTPSYSPSQALFMRTI